MPLFGKKSEKKSYSGGGYPTQPRGYPTQAAPMQGYGMQPGYGMQQPGAYAQVPQGPPPAYTATAQAPMPGYGQPGAPMMGYVTPIPAQNPQTVVVNGGFDAGARFGVGSQPNIPPPPPGVMPNAAQYASMAGHSVVVTQQKEDYFTGGGDGGYTVW